VLWGFFCFFSFTEQTAIISRIGNYQYFFLTLDLLLLPHEVSAIRFRGQPLAMRHMRDDGSCGGVRVLRMQPSQNTYFLKKFLH